jgi:hypothetical protein
MAWLCVDEDGDEMIFDNKPKRDNSPTCGGYWSRNEERDFCNVDLPKGTIKKLIGKNLTWEDEPYEYTGDVKKAKRKPNWNIGLLSLIWSSMVIVLGNIAWKTGPWATGSIIILTSLIFYFGYRDTDINEKES